MDGTYGSLILYTDGSYIYTADSKTADALAVGESATDFFTYTLSDTTDTDLAQLSFTITGANKRPIANDDSADIAENSSITKNTASGLIQSNDQDPNGDPVVITAARSISDANTPEDIADIPVGLEGASIIGTYGTLTLHADGSYRYNADLDTCDALDFGDTETDQFIYTLFDGFTTDEAQLSINISGRNDVPFLIKRA